MKAWKIFYCKGNSYFSVFIKGKAKIEYKPGEKTTSPQWLREQGYYPLVFDSKENAEIFWNYSLLWYVPMHEHAENGHPKILMVECGRKRKLMPICANQYLAKQKFQPMKNEIRPMKNADWPEGTMMVEWVRIPKVTFLGV